MRASLALLSLTLVTSAIAGPQVTPATPEVNERARQMLLRAFSSREALQKSQLVGDTLAVGPRLWAASRSARESFRADTKDVHGVVDRSVADQWKLEPVDLASLPDDVKPIVSALIAERGGVPVLSGAVIKRSKAILPVLIRTVAKDTEFPFSVRALTEDELLYYWATIPYDIKEPIWAVASESHAFLCHFDGSRHVFYLELL